MKREQEQTILNVLDAIKISATSAIRLYLGQSIMKVKLSAIENQTLGQISERGKLAGRDKESAGT
jgi:hypothetical protein